MEILDLRCRIEHEGCRSHNNRVEIKPIGLDRHVASINDLENLILILLNPS